MKALTRQRVLFASLAASAFLIYLDPRHGMNRVRALVVAHCIAATAGFAAFMAFHSPYAAAGSAMVVTIAAMVTFDVIHPTAVSTSIAFAFRAGDESNWMLFMLAVVMVAVLVIIERVMLRLVELWTAAGQRSCLTAAQEGEKGFCRHSIHEETRPWMQQRSSQCPFPLACRGAMHAAALDAILEEVRKTAGSTPHGERAVEDLLSVIDAMAIAYLEATGLSGGIGEYRRERRLALAH